MRTDKIRKYLILNIPYLFILWAFLKLGTAYRVAAGNDFAHKLIGLGQTIGPAFADFAPGLAPVSYTHLPEDPQGIPWAANTTRQAKCAKAHGTRYIHKQHRAIRGCQVL